MAAKRAGILVVGVLEADVHHPPEVSQVGHTQLGNLSDTQYTISSATIVPCEHVEFLQSLDQPGMQIGIAGVFFPTIVASWRDPLRNCKPTLRTLSANRMLLVPLYPNRD